MFVLTRSSCSSMSSTINAMSGPRVLDEGESHRKYSFALDILLDCTTRVRPSDGRNFRVSLKGWMGKPGAGFAFSPVLAVSPLSS